MLEPSTNPQTVDQFLAQVLNAPLTPEKTGMADDTLRSIIEQKIQSCHQWFGTGALASQRLAADKYYRGEPLGNEIEGRSSVVSRSLAEAVDGIIPSLLRIFASGDAVVNFEPFGPEDEEAAKQATDYVNYIFTQQNDGFIILHNWFKDALLKRNGIVKAWYEERTSRQKDNYSGLTQAQFQALSSDPTIQVLNVKEYPDPIASQLIAQQPPQIVMGPQGPIQVPPPPPPNLYDCTVMSAMPIKAIKVANVAPDEFVIERRAVSLEDAGFLAQRRKVAISDLLELGFDESLLSSIPTGDQQDLTMERNERFAEEEITPFGSEGETFDPTMRKVWLTEAYIRVDYDGDGVAEWRRVMLAGASGAAGNILLDNQEVDDHPFASITPKPEPHKFYGRCIYDDVKDLQEIDTVLWRGALDSLYLANSPRIGAVEGQVNLDDLLDARAGGVVRMKNPNAVVPLPSVMVAPQAFQMLEFNAGVREQRVGVTRYNQGLDADSLNKTATGVNIIANAGQQRLETIARIFAETGVKRLFRRIFQLTCLHEDKAKKVRLRGKWVDVDPQSWKNRMDVTVSVGIGMGNKDQQMNHAMMMLNLDKQIIQMQGGLNGPIVNGKNVYNKLTKLVEAMGWKNPEPYYSDPEKAPPQPPKGPSPDEQKDLVQLEMKKIDLAMKQMDLEMKRLETGHSIAGMVNDRVQDEQMLQQGMMNGQ